VFFTSGTRAVYIIHASERGLITVDREHCETRVALYHPETIGIVPNLRDGGWAVTTSHFNFVEAVNYARNMAHSYSLPINAFDQPEI
jgi:hypothetical protein